MYIREDDLQGPEIAELLREHLDEMAEFSPPQSVHALSLKELRAPSITMWTAWNDRELMGCGALKELDLAHGEIKSMRTARRHWRRGVATAILQRIIEEAETRRYARLSLETGSMEVFAPARAMYRKFGFEPCEPFGDYCEDRLSVFMTRQF